jgi:hypothetical protein
MSRNEGISGFILLDSSLESSHDFDYLELYPNDQRPDLGETTDGVYYSTSI